LSATQSPRSSSLTKRNIDAIIFLGLFEIKSEKDKAKIRISHPIDFMSLSIFSNSL
jgi:hypothetical protein